MSPSNDKYPWYLYMMFHTPSVEILAILKANGADFNQMEGYCCHDTLLARDFQWDALVKMLLRDKTGFLGVNDICKMARFLIDNGFDLNARNGRGKYPLHMLIRLIDNTTENELDKVYDILDYYLTHGANVNVYDYDKNTPLHLAVRHGLPRVVQVLLKHGADQSARNFNELTPLEVSKSIQAEKNMSHPNAHVYLAKVNETHGKIQQALSGATLENRQVSELVRQRSSLHAAQPQVDTKEEKLASTSFQFG